MSSASINRFVASWLRTCRNVHTRPGSGIMILSLYLCLSSAALASYSRTSKYRLPIGCSLVSADNPSKDVRSFTSLPLHGIVTQQHDCSGTVHSDTALSLSSFQNRPKSLLPSIYTDRVRKSLRDAALNKSALYLLTYLKYLIATLCADCKWRVDVLVTDNQTDNVRHEAPFPLCGARANNFQAGSLKEHYSHWHSRVYQGGNYRERKLNCNLWHFSSAFCAM